MIDYINNSSKMAENGTLRKEGKEGKEEKRLLVNTLASTINPLLKDMQADGSSLVRIM